MRSMVRPASVSMESRRGAHDGIAPTNRSWIAKAMSWLVTSAIEGMAAYGEAMCPCLADLPDRQAEHGMGNRSLVLLALSSQAQPDQAVQKPARSMLRRRVNAGLSGLLSGVHAVGKTRRTPASSDLEVLDERILRDVDLPLPDR